MSKKIRSKSVEIFIDERGKEPFTDWLNSLKDGTARRRILIRLRHLEGGNYGFCKPVGDGVFELRLFFGPGYRVYYAEKGLSIIILLCGGDKSTQKKDISIAKRFWKEYLTND